jgi:nucleoside-diphosphate-sugar epimerase
VKILITGTTGFIGSNLVRFLNRSEDNITCLVRKSSDISNLINLSPKVDILVDEGQNLENYFKLKSPEVLINFATYYSYSDNLESLEKMTSSNILLPAKLGYLSSLYDLDLFINVGSSFQLSEINRKINFYTSSKNIANNILDNFLEDVSTKLINVYLYDSYGPNDNREKLFFFLRNALASNKSLDMSPGLQKLNYLHIDDICRAFMQLIKNYKDNLPLNSNYGIFSNQDYSLKEIVHLYSQAMSEEIKINWGAKKYRPNEIMLPPKPFPKVENWNEQIDLFEGILDMEKKKLGFK